MDPRTIMIGERLRLIERIIAVSSGKGGVGKSMVATTLALKLVRMGYRVGLFDLDFTSPSTHLIMGIKDVHPKEEKGLIPPVVRGLTYMSLIHFSGDRVAPFRGNDVSNALIEFLSVTQWGKLDFLIIDMPPGISDAVLDLLRLVRNMEFLIVTTSSRLAFETVKKQVTLLKNLMVPIIGVVENMKIDKTKSIQLETEKLGVELLAEIPYDPSLEEAIGVEAKLLNTMFATKIKEVAVNSIIH